MKRNKYGMRAVCRHCAQDIEFSGWRNWTDRGGNRHCPASIKNGEIVRHRTIHKPFLSESTK